MADDQESRQKRINNIRDTIRGTMDNVGRRLLGNDVEGNHERIAGEIGELRRSVEELAEFAAAAGVQVELRGGRAGGDIVAEIVSDSGATPLLEVYLGHLGSSSRPGHDRLYTSPDMSTYLDIPHEAIVADAVAEHETDQPIPRSMVWIKAGTQVIRTRVDPVDIQRGFLQGAFSAEHCGCGHSDHSCGGHGHGHHCGCHAVPPRSGGGQDSRYPC